MINFPVTITIITIKDNIVITKDIQHCPNKDHWSAINSDIVQLKRAIDKDIIHDDDNGSTTVFTFKDHIKVIVINK